MAKNEGKACDAVVKLLEDRLGNGTMAVEHEPESETQAEDEGSGPWMGHAGIDRRALEMTRVIVEKIDREPRLVRVGLENIERWTRQKGGYR